MLRRLPACLALAVCALVAAALASAAAADDGFCRACGAPPGGSQETPDIGDGHIAVTVETFGQTNVGTTYRRPSTTRVPRQCWYRLWATGADYAALMRDPSFRRAQDLMPPQYRTTPLPGWESHDTDTQGAWYGPWCRDDADGAFVLNYLDTHPPVYWTPGQPTPGTAEQIEPRLLAQAAYDAMDLPVGTIHWNPSMPETGATVLGMTTWLWVTDAPTTATVRANVPSGPWAQVQATITDVTAQVTDPVPADVDCHDLGTPWTPDATTPTCSVVFHRSTAHLPTTPGQDHPTATVQVTTTWTATWTSWLNPDPQPLGEHTTTTSTQIPVAEIQTIVTR